MIGTVSANCQYALIIDLHQETRHKIKLFAQTVANMLRRLYLCIVFFIVLDLRLTKIGTQRSPFFYAHTLLTILIESPFVYYRWQRNQISLVC